MSDPYSLMLSLMEKQGSKFNPPSLTLGTVINVSPILIKIGSLQIDKDNLLIAEHLLSYTKKINFIGNLNKETIDREETGTLKNIQIESNLKIGDTLAVIPIEEGQKYIVLEKVV